MKRGIKMNFIKRLAIYIVILLLAFSMYQDLFKEANMPRLQDDEMQQIGSFYVIKKQVAPGENVLSIVEKVNKQEEIEIDIKQIMLDFKIANPSVNPYQLTPGKYYFFPVYSDEVP